MGESNTDGYDLLELEEGFTNAFLERRSEVDGTTISGEDSRRLTPRIPIDWTLSPVKKPAQ